jgi:hypothetical protein
MNRTDEAFGELAGFYIPTLDNVYSFLTENTFKYGFVVRQQYEELARADLPRALQIYWQEILMMTHMTSTTSLLRSRAWLNVTCQAIEDGNAIAFAGCFRAFLEAASDTYYALGNIPETLIDNRHLVKRKLAKEPGPALQIAGIEDQLIHFLRGREIARGESQPAAHRAKQAAEYFETLDKVHRGPVRELYGELCKLSHPSEGSVFIFLQHQPDGHQLLNPGGDPGFACKVVAKHRNAVETAFECGINTCLLALKVLNEFPIESLHTPLLDQIYFEDLPVGRRIKTKLGRSRW